MFPHNLGGYIDDRNARELASAHCQNETKLDRDYWYSQGTEAAHGLPCKYPADGDASWIVDSFSEGYEDVKTAKARRAMLVTCMPHYND